MNELKIFSNSEFGTVRTVEENGKIWFCGSDVSLTLGYHNPQKAIRDHCRKDGVTIRSVVDNLGRTQQAKFIDEGNLYRLICSSKLPAADKFERWVFDEVLPDIRHNGGYGLSNIKEIVAVTVAETVKQILPYIENHRNEDACSPHIRRCYMTVPAMPEYKIETFPHEIRAAIDSTLELMEIQNHFNFSAIAKWCTNNGYPVAYNTVQRYYRKRFKSDGRLEK